MFTLLLLALAIPRNFQLSFDGHNITERGELRDFLLSVKNKEDAYLEFITKEGSIPFTNSVEITESSCLFAVNSALIVDLDIMITKPSPEFILVVETSNEKFFYKIKLEVLQHSDATWSFTADCTMCAKRIISNREKIFATRSRTKKDVKRLKVK